MRPDLIALAAILYANSGIRGDEPVMNVIITQSGISFDQYFYGTPMLESIISVYGGLPMTKGGAS